MTAPVKFKQVLYQGATLRVPLMRQTVPYEIKGDACSGFVNACTGASVPPADFIDEDYAGCTARMQLRQEVASSAVLLECTTENGRIELVGNTLTLVLSAADTAALKFEEAIGHVEVVRPGGDVERQYEITFTLSPEGTR